MQRELAARMRAGGVCLRLAACAAVIAVVLVVGGEARADCNPAAATGGTVTCTSSGGTQTTPVGDGSQDNVIVNIQPGATVDLSGSPGATGIDLHDGNTVTNQGTVRVGDGALGVNVNNNNTVNNAGSIIFGDGSTGINGCCDNTIFNSGSISGGTSGYGIYVTDHTTITNSGTIAVGSGSYGILAYGDGSGATITNSGTITALGGYGIGAITGYNIINNNTINTGTNGIGIQVDGGNSVTNAGTIRGSGSTSFGIYLDAFSFGPPGSTAVNSGSILMSSDGYALIGDSDNTITNSGTLQGRVYLPGTGNTVTNRGYMINGDTSAFTSPGGSLIGGTLTNDASGTIAIRGAPTFSDYYFADNVTLNGGRLHMVIMPGLYGTTTVYSTATTGAAPVGTCGCGSVTGTFDTVTTSSPFFTATADYSSTTDVNVTLTRLGFGSVPGMTSNQRTVGNVLENGYSPSLDPTSTAGQFYANLLAANSVTVYDQLSGAGATGAQDVAFGAGGQFTTTMMQQALAWLTGVGGGNSVTVGGPLGYAPAPKNRMESRMAGHEAFAAMRPRAPEQGRWRAWGAGFASTRSVSGDTGTGTGNQTTRTAGGAFGVDHQVSPDFLLGVSAGGSGSSFSVSSLSTNGHIDGGHVGGYAIKTFGPAYLAGLLTYARFDNSTERTITGVGPTETAKGRFNSDLFGGRLELGWRYTLGGYRVMPFAAIEPTALRQQAYTESSTTETGGNGVLGLSYASHTTTSLPSFLGVQVDSRYGLAGGMLTPSLRLSWVHEFKPDRQIEASLVTMGSGSFTVDGARAARDALRTDLGATLALNQATALFASFNGEFSSVSTMVAGTAGAKVVW